MITVISQHLWVCITLSIAFVLITLTTCRVKYSWEQDELPQDIIIALISYSVAVYWLICATKTAIRLIGGTL